jgi:CO/xanthine dehydrogenase Mo-binding subunit
VPTLVIHGDTDRILPIAATGRRTQELGKGSRLVVVEGGPHGVTWTHAETVNRERPRFSMHAFGAVFAEVVVDPELCTVRVKRAVGAYGSGRIINPRLARRQRVGGMVGGIGMALMERTVLDPRDGRAVNATHGRLSRAREP